MLFSESSFEFNKSQLGVGDTGRSIDVSDVPSVVVVVTAPALIVHPRPQRIVVPLHPYILPPLKDVQDEQDRDDHGQNDPRRLRGDRATVVLALRAPDGHVGDVVVGVVAVA